MTHLNNEHFGHSVGKKVILEPNKGALIPFILLWRLLQLGIMFVYIKFELKNTMCYCNVAIKCSGIQEFSVILCVKCAANIMIHITLHRMNNIECHDYHRFQANNTHIIRC